MSKFNAFETARAVLGDHLDPSDLADANYPTIARLLNTVWDTSHDLRRSAASIRQDLDRVERYLDEGYNVNEMGELQSSGRRFEELCMRRQIALRTAIEVGAALVPDDRREFWADMVTEASKGE